MVPSRDQEQRPSADSADASVTQWIAGLKAGEAEAAERLCLTKTILYYFDEINSLLASRCRECGPV
jgi:hypothetical protein